MFALKGKVGKVGMESAPFDSQIVFFCGLLPASVGNRKTYYLCTLQVGDQILRVYPNGWLDYHLIQHWLASLYVGTNPPFHEAIVRNPG